MAIVFEQANESVAQAFAAQRNDAFLSIDRLTDMPNDTLNRVVYFGSANLALIYRVLKNGGIFEARIIRQENDAETQKNGLLMQALLQGFVNTSVDLVENEVRLSGTKPGFSDGASATVSIKPVTKPKWTVVADEEDDMIDEDDLLDDTDEVLKAAKDDCGPGKDGKKRRCKDCTCGRKDENDEPVVSEAELQLMVSNCGNCFKGDAFRCGSCPFLGQPAFKPGTTSRPIQHLMHPAGMGKVVLNLDNSDDI
ncbi:hypothetical protein THRCLA_09402 [Thraustotheca clavata]|uniref:Anamorsin homolog n=1 Tax=Thraustotheca clavata TaxID=74557 RepID=A0A1V9YWS2_9STRA|nr:hypothetical protein THRCLA_09402 [Thraustotheca clavata]